MVIAEEVMCHLEPKQRQRPFQRESPKDVLTVFFSWNDDPPPVKAYAVEAPNPKDTYQSIVSELVQRYSPDKNYFQDPHIVRP